MAQARDSRPIPDPGDRLRRMAKKKKATRRKKSAGKKSATRRRTAARRKKVSPSSKRSRLKQIVRSSRRSPLVTSLDVVIPSTRRGLGAHSAGQSGDTQGLSSVEDIDSESVEELVEEGQDFEAGAVAGIEEADASQGEVWTKQVPEDDVPREYLENDLDRLNRKSPVTRKTAAKQTAPSVTRVSRGPVDAPGKRHRKPLPQEPIASAWVNPGASRWARRGKTGRPRRATLAPELTGPANSSLTSDGRRFPGASQLLAAIPLKYRGGRVVAPPGRTDYLTPRAGVGRGPRRACRGDSRGEWCPETHRQLDPD